jgi:hypothetical protein
LILYILTKRPYYFQTLFNWRAECAKCITDQSNAIKFGLMLMDFWFFCISNKRNEFSLCKFLKRNNVIFLMDLINRKTPKPGFGPLCKFSKYQLVKKSNEARQFWPSVHLTIQNILFCCAFISNLKSTFVYFKDLKYTLLIKARLFYEQNTYCKCIK